MYDRLNVANGDVSVCRNRLHQVRISDSNVILVHRTQVLLNGLQAQETPRYVDVSPRLGGSSFLFWRVLQQVHQAVYFGGLPRPVQA